MRVRVVDASAAQRGKWSSSKRWYAFANRDDGKDALFRSIGRARHRHEGWTDIIFGEIIWPRRVSKDVRKVARRVLTMCCDDFSARAAIDSVYRLHGRFAAARLLSEMIFGPPEPLAPAVRLARRLEGVAKATGRREAHARAMLAKHERALVRAEQGVNRWARKVAAYDRRRRPA